MSTDPTHSPENSTSLSTFSVALLTATIIIGSGIFSIPTIIARLSPDEETFIWMWILGGICSFLGVLTYSELAVKHPESGGDALYLSREIHPSIGTLYLIAECLVIRPGAVVALLWTANDYLITLLPPAASRQFIPIGLLCVTMGIQLVRRELNIRLSELISLMKIVMLVALVVGAHCIAPAQVEPVVHSAKPLSELALALALTLFVFGGWSEVTFMMGEVRRGSRGYLLGAGLGLCLVTILYLALVLALLRVVGLPELRNNHAPFQSIAASAFGNFSAGFATTMVVICCVGAAHAVSISGIPLYIRLAQFNNANARASAALIQFIITGAFLFIARDIKDALVYTTPVVWCFAILTALAAVRVVIVGGHSKARVISPVIFLGISALLFYESAVYDLSKSSLSLGIVFFSALLMGLLWRKLPSSVSQ